MSFDFQAALTAADDYITNVIKQWDSNTTIIAVALVTFVAYLTFAGSDPDTHPALLARQAHANYVRQPGESPTYRSHGSPHGTPLNAGLNVRDEGQNKWTRGRNGDLRDVWRRVLSGKLNDQGVASKQVGKIVTVLGSEQTVDHDLAEVTKQITAVGQHLQKVGAKRVAIYLPNSIEYLATLFASAFYNITPVLLPFNESEEDLTLHLQNLKVDTIVAAAGMLPLDNLSWATHGLKNVIWVTDPGSQHLDFTSVPKSAASKIAAATWQDLVTSGGSATLPETDSRTPPPAVVSYTGEFTHANLVSAISAQLNAIPTSQKITNADLFFPADHLSSIYTLVITLGALYYNSSIALSSVARPGVDLTKATRGINPTIIVAHSTSLLNIATETNKKIGGLGKLVHWIQRRSLTQHGILPAATFLTSINDSLRPSIGSTPGKLRIVFSSCQLNSQSTPILDTVTLNDLRIFLGTRVVYALCSPKVAGAVTQTSFYDYRHLPELWGKGTHFGVPITSLELWVKDTEGYKVTDEKMEGEVSRFWNDLVESRANLTMQICVRGPAVVGYEQELGVYGRINEDHTLSLI
jgi:hypothetical protein